MVNNPYDALLDDEQRHEVNKVKKAVNIINNRLEKDMKTKPIYKGYDREVLMAEWKPINKEHHRRIRNCMIVSLCINIFLLLVMVLR